ncbi:hypothetical protein GQ457_05G012440 [Hibiscus cannabinus]
MISFFNHITSKFGSKIEVRILDRRNRNDHVWLKDERSKNRIHWFMLYLPSILAAATMVHVIKEIEPCHCLEYRKHDGARLKPRKEEQGTLLQPRYRCWNRLNDVNKG